MAQWDDAYSGSSTVLLRLIVTQGTQDIDNNRTVVNWSLTMLETANHPQSWSNISGDNDYSININGSVYSGNYTFDMRPSGNQSKVLRSGSTTVNHNADGTKTISVSASATTNISFGNANITTKTLALTTIPRASQPTFSPSPVDIGSNVTVTTNRMNASFTHQIEWTLGGHGGVVASNVGASAVWTVPTSFYALIPDGTAATLTIMTWTYNGATLIGTSAKSLVINVPTSIVPNFTSITAVEATSGVAANVGAFVQSISKLALTMTGAVAGTGASIASYKMVVAGQTINAVSGTTPQPVNGSGTVGIVGTVTDSRGRTFSKTVNVTFLAYAPPVINAVSVQRANAAGTPDESGTYLRVNINASVSSLINSTQRNAITYRVSTRVRNTPPWSVKPLQSPGGITFNSYYNMSGYSITTAYDVLVEIIDDFTTSAIQINVPVAAVFMHWNANLGVGIGKYHENGRLDVAGDIYAGTLYGSAGYISAKNASVLATDYPNGSSVMFAGDTVSGWPSTYGTVHTIKSYGPGVSGGTIQYWVGYNTNAGEVLFRQTLYPTSTWTAWQTLAVKGGIGIPFAMAAGLVSHPSSIAMNTGVDVAITFPAGRFSVTPIVQATVDRSARLNVAVNSLTTSGFTARLDNWSNNAAATPIGVFWSAIQMTAGAAAG